MTPRVFPRRQARDVGRPAGVDTDGTVADTVRAILADVRDRGEPAVREYAARFGDLPPGPIGAEAPIVLGRDAMDAAVRRIEPAVRALLERTAARIEAFARAQRACLTDLSTSAGGWGEVGHRVQAVASAGCYAPGGRYPLPSSVLMTVIPARVAGVNRIVVASPRPSDATLAAAATAGADCVIRVGGAQAVALLAYGLSASGGGPPERDHAGAQGGDPTNRLAPVDIIVGPGNRYVTAAKAQIAASGVAGIDMLAGPSEVLIIADETADAALIAADLLAQAEHDADAVPMLVTTSAGLADRVEAEVNGQLDLLPEPSRGTAAAAIGNGFIATAASIDEAIALANRRAPEHLQVMTRDPRSVADRCTTYGAVFIGSASAEVLGDYGAGPNHVLPTAGTARYCAGLSVFTFLRVATRLSADAVGPEFERMCEDARALGEVEGLQAHARAAAMRARLPGPAASG